MREGKRPMPDIVVTDGQSFTYTDKNGNYSMETADDARFVHILTPKGFVADYSNGVPQFYHRLKGDISTYDFELFRMHGSSNKTLMIATADTQLDKDDDVKRMFQESLPDMQNIIKQYPDRNTAMFIAGDLTWDVYGKNSDVTNFAKQLGIPLYPVIGNHDYDKYVLADKGPDFAQPYEDAFGPLYYAFQFGDTYYVVLNNIKYTGNKKYTNSLVQGHQMEWLQKLLGVVLQQNNNVFIIAHAPICRPGGVELIEGGKQLKDMLVGKPFKSAFFTGHLHNNSVTDLGNGIWEYNLSSLGGYWWSGNFSGDGTPNGYKIILGEEGGKWTQYYKSTSMELNEQFQIYAPGQICERPTSVCCKIWNWDTRWQVRWYEDSQLMGSMSQFYTYSPEYLCMLDGEIATGDYTPLRTNHFFSCKPAPSAHTITVEVVDPYGNRYKKSLTLKQ